MSGPPVSLSRRCSERGPGRKFVSTRVIGSPPVCRVRDHSGPWGRDPEVQGKTCYLLVVFRPRSDGPGWRVETEGNRLTRTVPWSAEHEVRGVDLYSWVKCPVTIPYLLTYEYLVNGVTDRVSLSSYLRSINKNKMIL